MEELLAYIARNLVDDPEAVSVTATEGHRQPVLQLRVAPDDMGKVIGRAGRTARAIRTLVKAAGARDRVRPAVDIVE